VFFRGGLHVIQEIFHEVFLLSDQLWGTRLLLADLRSPRSGANIRERGNQHPWHGNERYSHHERSRPELSVDLYGANHNYEERDL
jgi:hypothetical protein